MIKLETKFTKGTWNFEQVKRDGNIAIYRRWQDNIRPHFEVIVIQELPRRELFGRVYDPSEHYPSSEQWGSLAWTCMDLARADARAATLIPVKSP